MEAAGFLVGAYAFLTQSDGALQAAHLLATAPGLTVYAGDWERNDVSGAPAATKAQVIAFAQHMHAATGRWPLVYGSNVPREQATAPDEILSKCPLWTARYASHPEPLPGAWSDWLFWQYTSSGTIPGIARAVDRNKYQGAKEQLRAWWEGTTMDAAHPKIVKEPEALVVDCHAEVLNGVTRCDLRPLAEACGYDVHPEHLDDTGRIYLKPKTA